MVRVQVLHRDMKPANILLHNGKPKIADFGFAKLVDFSLTDYTQHMVSVVGTPLYMSPQLLEKKKYTSKSDIWSIGIIYFEMLFGKVPWPGKDPKAYVQNIRTQPLVIERKIHDISPEAEDFVRRCLHHEEENRMGYEEMFEHPLITGEPFLKDDHSNSDVINGLTPEKHMQEYETRSAQPSLLMKQYQEKVLQASREVLQPNDSMIKTTIDQKLKYMDRLILT